MKAQIKILNGTKWRAAKVEELVGKSVNQFILEHPEPAIGCLYDDQDNYIAFVANTEELVAQYKPKAFSILAKDLAILLGTEVIPHVLAQTFSGDFIEIKSSKGRNDEKEIVE
jgi:hypothetical protein